MRCTMNGLRLSQATCWSSDDRIASSRTWNAGTSPHLRRSTWRRRRPQKEVPPLTGKLSAAAEIGRKQRHLSQTYSLAASEDRTKPVVKQFRSGNVSESISWIETWSTSQIMYSKPIGRQCVFGMLGLRTSLILCILNSMWRDCGRKLVHWFNS